MKISTRGRYALRMMLDLALHDGEYIAIKNIAERQEYPISIWSRSLRYLADPDL